MPRRLAWLLLAAIAAGAPLAAGCSDSPAPSAAAAQASGRAAKPVISCELLTKAEVEAAAGWQVTQVTPTENPGPPALSICNFMGSDLTKVITVWYGEGSGGRPKTSAEMAAALGTRDGMLARPAQPLEDLGLPATREDQHGDLVHVHGVKSASGDELIVAAASFDVARALFVKALARFK